MLGLTDRHKRLDAAEQLVPDPGHSASTDRLAGDR
jgi:hypothetical protein